MPDLMLQYLEFLRALEKQEPVMVADESEDSFQKRYAEWTIDYQKLVDAIHVTCGYIKPARAPDGRIVDEWDDGLPRLR